MSGLGRLFADQQRRFDATMLRAQIAWDNRAPEDEDDEELLTPEQALDQARDETLSGSAWVADALARLTDTPDGRESVDVHAIVSGEDAPLDCVTVETLAVHQLLAIVMIGADKAAMTALRELRERMAFHLRDDIKQRAMDLLVEQEREWLRMRDDAAMDRYLDRLEVA